MVYSIDSYVQVWEWWVVGGKCVGAEQAMKTLLRLWLMERGSMMLGLVTSCIGTKFTSQFGDQIAGGLGFVTETKHDNILILEKCGKNWRIPAMFPSDVVISAYASSQVDKSTEPFSWGKPDLFVLRKLCYEKFGWGSQKADELLQPVLKEYNKHEVPLALKIRSALWGVQSLPSQKSAQGKVRPFTGLRIELLP
ncbi:DNA repair protein UVH3 isoform X1 [Tanacetum coccineum]|uniref:DNA repair protein UVH3 isoform X1 n=1 Tax=Tanacetum coccineum TaxID=301880 RepID=A0ABQ5C0Y5_9ASTR